MGAAHARAYQRIDGYRLAGVVSRGADSRGQLASALDVPAFASLEEGLQATQPAVVSINTHPDSHYGYAIRGLEAGCHLFVEKPLAETVAEAERIVAVAQERGRQVVVGYILRHHPSWRTFIEHARRLGKPLAMRMNLNQQSTADQWLTHKSLMRSMSPIVDCGVHYVDVMSQMTGARPLRVQAIGARLSEEIEAGMYNYGQLQVVFDDGSVGWYEAGWGPMLSETAYFVKDVVGPLGSVSMVDHAPGQSAVIDSHTGTGGLLVHSAATDANGDFATPDQFIDTASEPNHDELCEIEQRYLLAAIGDGRDLSSDLRDAVDSLRIVLAADESVRSGATVPL